MLFFYIRHGDHIYNPDSLTALGQKQADALARRLSVYGVDRIYASSSNRAIQTAKPICDLLKRGGNSGPCQWETCVEWVYGGKKRNKEMDISRWRNKDAFFW